MQKILSADSHELKAVTGLRGAAALSVVCFHFSKEWTLLLPGLKIVSLFSTGVGALGVDLFFIMSGFILCYVYRYEAAIFDRGFLGKFIWFRFARIYPNHIATLLILGAMVVTAHIAHVQMTGSYLLMDLPSQLTMTHAWPLVPHTVPGTSWNYPSWSISAEWFAYLFIFPLSLFFLKRRISLLPCILLISGSVIIALLGSPRLWSNFPNGADLVRVSFEFLAGGLTFGLALWQEQFVRWMQQAGSFIGILLLGLIAFCAIDYSFFSVAIVLLFPFLLLGMTADTSRTSKLLSHRFVFWLGKISYAIYMSHAIFQKIQKIVLPLSYLQNANFFLRLGAVVGSLASIIGLAALLYYSVEVPARNYLRVHRPRWARERTLKTQAPSFAL